MREGIERGGRVLERLFEALVLVLITSRPKEYISHAEGRGRGREGEAEGETNFLEGSR